MPLFQISRAVTGPGKDGSVFRDTAAIPGLRFVCPGMAAWDKSKSSKAKSPTGMVNLITLLDFAPVTLQI